MIFQLSDWFPKPMIWAIIIKFDQLRKNWWWISCAEILDVGKIFFHAVIGKENVTIWGGFTRRNQENCLIYHKQLLDEVFVISGIIKVEVSVISRSLRLTTMYNKNSYSSRTCRIWADNNQLAPTASLVIYISSYLARPQRITVNYYISQLGGALWSVNFLGCILLYSINLLAILRNFFKKLLTFRSFDKWVNKQLSPFWPPHCYRVNFSWKMTKITYKKVTLK